MVFGLCYFLSFLVFVFSYLFPRTHQLPHAGLDSVFVCRHCVNKYKTDQQWKYIVCIQKSRRSFCVRMKQVYIRVYWTYRVGDVRVDFFHKCTYKSICMMSNELEMRLCAIVVFIELNFFALVFFHSSFCMSRSNDMIVTGAILGATPLNLVHLSWTLSLFSHHNSSKMALLPRVYRTVHRHTKNAYMQAVLCSSEIQVIYIHTHTHFCLKCKHQHVNN